MSFLIKYTKNAAEDVAYWQKTNKATYKRLKKLIEAIATNPYKGIGKPEPLAFSLQGCWSRRLTHEHRLVYRVEQGKIIILQARYHYTK